MSNTTSVRVAYWTEQVGPTAHIDLHGVDAFRETLSRDYVAVVRSRPGDLGGLYSLAVEFLTSISLADFAKLVAGGMAYDLVESGTQSFVLRPFMQAFQSLADRNPNRSPDLEVVDIVYRDATVTIRQIYPRGIGDNIGSVLSAVSQHLPQMTLRSGEQPVHIYVPIFEDPAEDRLIRFREPLEVELTPNAAPFIA